jgi:signal peptidase II
VRVKKSHSLFFGLLLLVLLVDQFSKFTLVYLWSYHPYRNALEFAGRYFTAVGHMPFKQFKPGPDILPRIFSVTLITNDGAAFSLFKGRPELLSAVSFVLIVLLLFLYFKYGHLSLLLRIGFGMQIGGALGNFIDRVRMKEVVDFLDFHIRSANFYFPIFNVADSCAVVGTCLILIFLLFGERGRAEKPLWQRVMVFRTEGPGPVWYDAKPYAPPDQDLRHAYPPFLQVEIPRDEQNLPLHQYSSLDHPSKAADADQDNIQADAGPSAPDRPPESA